MHYVSLCAIFKQENEWLEEWLRYHQHLGIEHFYMYNNDDDRTESDRILRPYVEKGVVDNIPFDGKSVQIQAYTHAAKEFAQQTFWLGFLDLDEFILPKKTDSLTDFLGEYEDHSGLAIHWNIFGSSGHNATPPNQINHFLHRAEKNHPVNRHVKSIVRANRIVSDRIASPHLFPLTVGRNVDEYRDEIHAPISDYSGDLIRIVHYIVRSRQWFQDVKMTRGIAVPIAMRDDGFWKHHDRNEVYDDEISRRFGHLLEVGIQ